MVYPSVFFLLQCNRIYRINMSLSTKPSAYHTSLLIYQSGPLYMWLPKLSRYVHQKRIAWAIKKYIQWAQHTRTERTVLSIETTARWRSAFILFWQQMLVYTQYYNHIPRHQQEAHGVLCTSLVRSIIYFFTTFNSIRTYVHFCTYLVYKTLIYNSVQYERSTYSDVLCCNP